MAKKILFPFPEDGHFNAVTCLKISIDQRIALSSFDIEKVNRILSLCEELFKIPKLWIIDEGRKHEACMARFLFASTILKITKLSYACIGSFLSGRHYSTVIHMLKMHHEHITSRDPRFTWYKNASIAVDKYILDISHETCDNQEFWISTQKKRMDDLRRFSKSLGIEDVSDDIIKNYISQNSI